MLGKVLVISIQIIPRLFLRICKPQNPIFFTTKIKPTLGAIKYKKKISFPIVLSPKISSLFQIIFYSENKGTYIGPYRKQARGCHSQKIPYLQKSIQSCLEPENKGIIKNNSHNFEFQEIFTDGP